MGSLVVERSREGTQGLHQILLAGGTVPEDMLSHVLKLYKSMEEWIIDSGIVKILENRKPKGFQSGPKLSIQALHDR